MIPENLKFNYETDYSPYAWWLLAGKGLYGSVMVVGDLPEDDKRIIGYMASRLNIVSGMNHNGNSNSISDTDQYNAIIINAGHAEIDISIKGLIQKYKERLTSLGVIIIYMPEFSFIKNLFASHEAGTDILPCISYNKQPFEAFSPGYYYSNKNQCLAKEKIKTFLYNHGLYRFFLGSGLVVYKNYHNVSSLLEDILEEVSKKLPVHYGYDHIKLSKYYFRYGKVIVQLECMADNKSRRYIVVIPTDRLALIQRRNEKMALEYVKSIQPLSKYTVDFYIETEISGLAAYIMDDAKGITVDTSCADLYNMTLNASRVIEDLAQYTLRTGSARDVYSRLSAYIHEFNKKMSTYGPVLASPSDRFMRELQQQPIVFMHGDMKLENFVLDNTNKVNKIIDWEQSDTDGWLLLDLFYLICYDMHIVDDMDFISAFNKLYDDSISLTYKDIIKSYTEKFCINHHQYRILLALFFIHHYAYRVIVERMSGDTMRQYHKALDVVIGIIQED
jgi:hypothetical protein